MTFQFSKTQSFSNAFRARAETAQRDAPQDQLTGFDTDQSSTGDTPPEQRVTFLWEDAGDGPVDAGNLRITSNQNSQVVDDTDLPVDHFDFAPIPRASSDQDGPEQPGIFAAVGDDGRPDPDTPPPDTGPQEDTDPDPAPAPVDPLPEPPAPTESGRPGDATPGTPTNTPLAPAPSGDNAESGRDPDATPDIPPDTGPATSYTSGGPAASSFNVRIEFVGTWTTDLQDAFTDAADYLSSIILADIPDVIVDGVAIDDITITATLAAIDGVGGTLGSAGPRDLRNDGTYLSATGAMTFDSADAQNQLGLGNWEAIVLHEMMHALGFGTLWSLMGLVSGSVAGGDIRFIGQNAVDTYQTEFPGIAGGDPDSLLGVPVETDGGPGTAGGHWDEALFDAEIMTGFIDSGAFFSLMTIASLEDMGYDTVFDNPYSATDLSGPIPADPLVDLFA